MTRVLPSRPDRPESRPGRPAPRPGRYAVPAWLWAPAAAGLSFLVLPVGAMVVAADWPNFWGLVTSESALVALGLSLRTAAAATLLSLALGIPLAVVLARGDVPGHRLVRAAVLLPLVLPPVVGGLALLLTYGRTGLLGGALEAFGIRLAFSTAAVVLAQTFVAMPFLVISLEGALRTGTEAYERVAATLGAAPGTVLRRITLPLVGPGLVSGTVLAFARALGEFGATLTFAGSLQGTTRTLPLEVYLQREVDPAAAVAISLVLVAIGALVVLAVGARALAGPGPGAGDRRG